MIKTLGLILGMLSSPVSQNTQLIVNNNNLNQQVKSEISQNIKYLNNSNKNDNPNLVNNQTLYKSAVLNSQSIFINDYKIDTIKNRIVTPSNDSMFIREIYTDNNYVNTQSDNWGMYWVSGYFLNDETFKIHNFYGELKLNSWDDSLVATNEKNKYNYGIYFRSDNLSATPKSNLQDVWGSFIEFYLKWKYKNLSEFPVFSEQITETSNTEDGYMTAHARVIIFDENGKLSNLYLNLVYDFWNPQKSITSKRNKIDLFPAPPMTKQTFENVNGVTKYKFYWYGKVIIWLDKNTTEKFMEKIVDKDFEKGAELIHEIREIVEVEELEILEGIEVTAEMEAEIIPGILPLIVAVISVMIDWGAILIITDIIYDYIMMGGSKNNHKGIIINMSLWTKTHIQESYQ